MVTPELIAFIKQQISNGINFDQVKQSLQSKNWSIDDINSAFAQLQISINSNQSISPEEISISKTNSTKIRRYPMLIIVSIIFILFILTAGLLLFLNKPSQKNITVGELTQIAESINPYIPDGYSVLYKAKLVNFPSGGVLFETRLVKDDNKIGITIRPGNNLDCEYDTKQIDNKTVCVYNATSSKSIKWTDEKVIYDILTGNPSVTMDDLEKIARSL